MSIEKKINKLIIISSPSGAGKTTICKYLLKKMKNIDLSISYTTRQKRGNEIDSKDYYFTDNHNFLKLKKNKYFIETAKIFNNHYGSPYLNINKSFKNGNHILFDIDWQGARKLRKNFDKTKIIDFFILPPNKKELEKRLISRNQDKEEIVNKRLESYSNDIVHWHDYDYVVINDNLESCFKQIESIINNSKNKIINFN